MYSWAPRCSDAWSVRSTPACCRSPPETARTEADTSSTAVKMASLDSTRLRVRRIFGLVLHRHAFRHRRCLVDLGPQRHRDEEGEIEACQELAYDRDH